MINFAQVGYIAKNGNPFFLQIQHRACVKLHESESDSSGNLSGDRSHKVQFSDPTIGHFH